MASDLPLVTVITVDSSVVYDSSGTGVRFFDFDSWARNNVVPGCDHVSKIDLLATDSRASRSTWFIEVKDFRYIHHKPREKNTIKIADTLEGKIRGTLALLTHPDCLQDVKEMYSAAGTNYFLYHYEKPLNATHSAYFPAGYPVNALLALRQRPEISSVFHKMYAATAADMNASDVYPWSVKLLDSRNDTTA